MSALGDQRGPAAVAQKMVASDGDRWSPECRCHGRRAPPRALAAPDSFGSIELNADMNAGTAADRSNVAILSLLTYSTDGLATWRPGSRLQRAVWPRGGSAT
jgi:hypothetical protein